jgi:hypothetical protein
MGNTKIIQNAESRVDIRSDAGCVLSPSSACMNCPDYRPFVSRPGSRARRSHAAEHTQARLQSPRAKELFGGWAELAKAQFTGITTDGHVSSTCFRFA